MIINKEGNKTTIDIAGDFDEAIAATAFMISSGKKTHGVFSLNGAFINIPKKGNESAPEYKEKLTKWFKEKTEMAVIFKPKFILW